MSWAVGYNSHLRRDIGYGVPSYCDYPGCYEEIDRGLSYICGGLYYEEHGCGLVFCAKHMYDVRQDGNDYFSVCDQCAHGRKPYKPSPDTDEWIEHKMTDPSWAEWRDSLLTEGHNQGENHDGTGRSGRRAEDYLWAD